MLQPNYLTFSELLARWNCEPKNIHTLIQECFLQPSIIWNEALIVCEWQRNLEDESILDLVELDASNPPRKFFPSHLASIKGNWLNLIMPRRAGAYQYNFRYVVLGQRVSNDGDQWYRLAHYDDMQKLSYKNIAQDDVEKMAVFMTDVVIAFEANHPNDLAQSKAFANQKELGRRDQQHKTISETIVELNFKPLEIPERGKAQIKKICLSKLSLFTDAGFDHAWKAGLNKNLFKMKDAEKHKR